MELVEQEAVLPENSSSQAALGQPTETVAPTGCIFELLERGEKRWKRVVIMERRTTDLYIRSSGLRGGEDTRVTVTE
jgi:hypothetical protein